MGEVLGREDTLANPRDEQRPRGRGFGGGLIASILAAVLIALTYPAFSLSILAFIGLVPLLYGVDRCRTVRQAFTLGYVFGFIVNFVTLWWVTAFGLLPLILLAVAFSISYGFIAVGFRAALRRTSGVASVLIVSLFWTGADFLKLFGFWALPWLYLGYTQHKVLPLIQIADVTGVFGVTFLIVLVNAAIYRLVFRRDSLGRSLAVGGLALALVCGTAYYGIVRLEERWSGAPFALAIVQGGLRTDVEWTEDFRTLSARVYRGMTERLLMGRKADITLFPEVAIPYDVAPGQPQSIPPTIRDLPGKTQGDVIFGTYLRTGRGLYNSANLLTPQFTLTGVYSKMRLVPYGECVPMGRLVRFLRYPWGDEDLSAGSRIEPIPTQFGRVGAAICFDSVFPYVFRDQAANGAGFLAVMTNNSWYPDLAGVEQHADIDVFRAVENRRYLARAATTGVSHLVSPTGAILESTLPYSSGFIYATAQMLTGKTFYTAHGDVFGLACFVLAALAGFYLFFVDAGVWAER